MSRGMLEEANEMLRSLYAVALREGQETHWHGIQRALQRMLVAQSIALNGTDYFPAATAAARTYRQLPHEGQNSAQAGEAGK